MFLELPETCCNFENVQELDGSRTDQTNSGPQVQRLKSLYTPVPCQVNVLKPVKRQIVDYAHLTTFDLPRCGFKVTFLTASADAVSSISYFSGFSDLTPGWL